MLVTSEEPLLDTEKTEVSQSLDEQIISNLPVNGRRWDNFVLLTPNVAPDGNSGLISYRGVSGLYNSNQVDGANNDQAFFSEARGRAIGSPYVYSQDSVQESSQPFPATARSSAEPPADRSMPSLNPAPTRCTATSSTSFAIPLSTRSILSARRRD